MSLKMAFSSHVAARPDDDAHGRRRLRSLLQLDDRQMSAPRQVGDAQLEPLSSSAPDGSTGRRAR